LIGLAVHRNLLRLYGFCMTSKERLLVYPYMPNGSVADRLRGNFNCLSATFSMFVILSRIVIFASLSHCLQIFFF
jgi:hypothetical protein